ncbi:MAG: crotonase [Acidimicrobiales bacterium]|nr:MAG: crotonase [Acidimicrobiales bacterium]
MDWATLEVRREGPVGWIIFDRPDAGNAIDAAMFDELERAWSAMEADDAVRVVVNTGNGRTFQTGLDVVQLARDKEALRESSRRTRDFTLRMTGWHCGVTKPVIAAVNGTCAGGGLHFVADADLVIAGERATFLDPHVRVGQVSAFETTGLLKKAPAESVLRMALVGGEERLSAHRAHQLGIVGEVVPDAELRDRAEAMAEAIAAESADALAMVKAAAWERLERP